MLGVRFIYNKTCNDDLNAQPLNPAGADPPGDFRLIDRNANKRTLRGRSNNLSSVPFSLNDFRAGDTSILRVFVNVHEGKEGHNHCWGG